MVIAHKSPENSLFSIEGLCLDMIIATDQLIWKKSTPSAPKKALRVPSNDVDHYVYVRQEKLIFTHALLRSRKSMQQSSCPFFFFTCTKIASHVENTLDKPEIQQILNL